MLPFVLAFSSLFDDINFVKQDGLNGFLSFINLPQFRELPSLVQSAVSSFLSKNPKVEVPKNFHKIAGLIARIQDSPATAPPRRATSSGTQNPSGSVPVRPDRVRRIARGTVRLQLFSLFLSFF